MVSVLNIAFSFAEIQNCITHRKTIVNLDSVTLKIRDAKNENDRSGVQLWKLKS